LIFNRKIIYKIIVERKIPIFILGLFLIVSALWGEEPSKEIKKPVPIPSSFYGGTGLFRIRKAGIIEKKSFSIGGYGGWAYVENFMNIDREGGYSNIIDSSINFTYGIWDYVEGYMTLLSRSGTLENDIEDIHNVYHAIGDIIFGAKGFYPFMDWFKGGGGIFFKGFTKTSGVFLKEPDIGFGLEFFLSAELERFVTFPFNLHFNLGYIFINNDDLGYRTIDEAQWLLMNAIPSDYINWGIGFEFPFVQYYISPFVEYSMEAYLEKCIRDNPLYPMSWRRPAWNENPQRFTFGIRGFPYKGLWADFMVDLYVTKGYEGKDSLKTWDVQRFPKWQMFFGIGYSFLEAFRPKEKKEEEAKIYRPPGWIEGKIISSKTKKPLKDVRVEVKGAPFSAVITEKDGTFKFPSLPPGVYKVAAEKMKFKKAEKIVEVSSGEKTIVEIPLEPMGNIGGIKGVITDIRGMPLSAVITPENPQIPPIVTDPTTGAFFGVLPEGPQVLTVRSKGYVGKKIKIPVKKGKIIKFSMKLRPAKKKGYLGAIEGIVLDEKGNPLLADISFYKDLHPPLKTDPNTGKFFVKLPPGYYKIKVSAPEKTAKIFKIEVKEKVKKKVKITLSPRIPSGLLAGKVIDEEGNPVVASISFDDVRVPVVTSNPQTGEFKVKAPAGEYMVTVSAPDYEKKSFKVTIKDKTKIKTIITLKKVGKEEVARKAEIILYAACDNMNVVNEKAELLKKEGYNVLFTASSPLGKMDISQIRYFPAFENEAMKIGDLLTTQFIPIEDPLVKGINVYLGCGYIK
jgi:hypothetical protein